MGGGARPPSRPQSVGARRTRLGYGGQLSGGRIDSVVAAAVPPARGGAMARGGASAWSALPPRLEAPQLRAATAPHAALVLARSEAAITRATARRAELCHAQTEVQLCVMSLSTWNGADPSCTRIQRATPRAYLFYRSVCLSTCLSVCLSLSLALSLSLSLAI